MAQWKEQTTHHQEITDKKKNLISRDWLKMGVQMLNYFEWGTKLSWRYFNILFHLSHIYGWLEFRGMPKFMELF